ncbi:MAG TPA: hypothetical protein VJ949_03915, partial [Cryomorphaceae bacterium]|nr:hypothetical protein [Cryomorphaceae bacterium]
PPRMLVRNLEMVLNNELRELFANGELRISIRDLKRVVGEIKKWNFSIDHTELDFICANKLDRMLAKHGDPSLSSSEQFGLLVANMRESLEILGTVGIYPELNHIQDVVFHYLQKFSAGISPEVRDELFKFAQQINIEIGKFKNVTA